MKDNWKLWLATIACVGVLAFCARRAYVAFHGGPPDWIRQEDRVGSALDKDDRLKTAWKKFSDLLGSTRAEAERQQLPIGNISLFALEKDGTNALSIVTQAVVNQGFNPLQNAQAALGGDGKGFVGFYTTNGEPIPYTIVWVKGRTRNPPVTLHLSATVAPGGTQLVMRVEWRRGPVSIGKDGKLQAGLGRFPRTPNAIYTRAIRLPSGSVIVRSVPDKTVTVSVDEAPLVSWIGTAANANAPMSVVFTLPKP
jgi:hypothetical protein